MKHLLLLENHHEQDIPEELVSIIKSDWFTSKFTKEIWTHFHESYWPVNREATVKRLAAADGYIARHVFVDWCQLEIFIEVLMKFKKMKLKKDLYLYHYNLAGTLKKWYEDHEAYTTPDTRTYNDSWEKRRKFKDKLNKQLLKVLDYHNVYGITSFILHNKEIKPIRSTDLLNAEAD